MPLSVSEGLFLSFLSLWCLLVLVQFGSVAVSQFGFAVLPDVSGDVLGDCPGVDGDVDGFESAGGTCDGGGASLDGGVVEFWEGLDC